MEHSEQKLYHIKLTVDQIRDWAIKAGAVLPVEAKCTIRSQDGKTLVLTAYEDLV